MKMTRKDFRNDTYNYVGRQMYLPPSCDALKREPNAKNHFSTKGMINQDVK